MTKQEAVAELYASDHAFLFTKTVHKITEPFGFKGSVYIARDTRNQHKGLTLPDGMKEAEGQDADIVACQIADKLSLDYPEMYGRGSRLRAAAEAVEQHLRKTGEWK